MCLGFGVHRIEGANFWTNFFLSPANEMQEVLCLGFWQYLDGF